MEESNQEELKLIIEPSCCNPITNIIQDDENMCLVCYEPIKLDDTYAIINGSPEGKNIKYHGHCVEQWFNHKDNVKQLGIISRQPVSSYSLYIKDELVGTIELNNNTTTITHKHTCDSENLKPMYTTLLCVCLVAIILIILVIVINKIMSKL